MNESYPPDSAELAVGRVCPAVGSRPSPLPPAAASPASFPGIRRRPSPRTHHLSETSLALSIKAKQGRLSFLPWKERRQEEWNEVLLSVGGRAAAPSGLSASAALLFVSSRKVTRKNKNVLFAPRQCGKKGDGLCYFRMECDAFCLKKNKKKKRWHWRDLLKVLPIKSRGVV